MLIITTSFGFGWAKATLDPTTTRPINSAIREARRMACSVVAKDAAIMLRAAVIGSGLRRMYKVENHEKTKVRNHEKEEHQPTSGFPSCSMTFSDFVFSSFCVFVILSPPRW